MDLVVAVPFTMAVSGLFATTWNGSEIARRDVVAFGALLTMGWFVTLRFLSPEGDALRWALAALTVLVSFYLQRHFDARSVPADRTSAERGDRTVATLVFAT